MDAGSELMRMFLVHLKQQFIYAVIAIGCLRSASAYDSIPKELRSSEEGVSNTLKATWDRTLTFEEDAKAEGALQIFEQGVKSAEGILHDPTRLKNNDPGSWDAKGKPAFEEQLANYQHAVQLLTTPGEDRSAFLDRAGIFTLEVAPGRPARRVTHEDTRDLNALLARWRADKRDSFVLANFHNSVRENAYGNREEISSIERNVLVGAGPRSREAIQGRVREELLWLGILDSTWDAVGKVSAKRNSNKSLKSVTVTQKSGEASIDWTFGFDESTPSPQMTSARLEVAGRTWESWTLQDWSSFQGRFLPGTATREKFNHETGALESTETRTLISVEPLDPKTIWD